MRPDKMEKSWTGTSAEVTLERGGTLRAARQPWKRNFTVTNADGASPILWLNRACLGPGV